MVQISRADTSLMLHARDSEAVQKRNGADDRKVRFDTAPFENNGTFYIPLRSVEELGLDVQWDAQTVTVILREATASAIHHVRTGGDQVASGVCIKCQIGTAYATSTNTTVTAIHSDQRSRMSGGCWVLSSTSPIGYSAG